MQSGGLPIGRGKHDGVRQQKRVERAPVGVEQCAVRSVQKSVGHIEVGDGVVIDAIAERQSLKQSQGRPDGPKEQAHSERDRRCSCTAR